MLDCRQRKENGYNVDAWPLTFAALYVMQEQDYRLSHLVMWQLLALVHFRTLVNLRTVRVRVKVGLELRLGLVRVRIRVRIRLGLDLGLGLG